MTQANPERAIRLLIAITDLRIGGTPLDVLRLAKWLPRDRFRVLVVSLADVGPVGERLRAAGIAVEACNARNARDLRALGRLYRIIREFQPDVIHSMLFHANVAVRLIAPAAGVPLDRIVCGILTVERERLWHLWVETATCRRCRCVVANSQSVVDHLHHAAHVPRSRLRFIRGAIDTRAVTAAQPVPRGDLGIPDDTGLVLWVGRLDPVKGLDELVEAAVLLSARRPVQVLLVGDGNHESSVRQRVAQANASRFVRLLGRRDDVANLLAAADVFVFPSRSEGLPNALIEAMTAGKAIVTTDAPGCRDLVRHEQTGLIVPVGDAQALAKAMERLLASEELRGKLGLAAARWAQSHCEWSTTAPEWIELYEQTALQ